MTMERLKTTFGLDDGTASRVLGTFDAGWIQELLAFAETEGPVFTKAAAAAIPWLLRGKTSTAMIVFYNSLISQLKPIPVPDDPPAPAPEPKQGVSMPTVEDSPPAAWSDPVEESTPVSSPKKKR